MKQPELGKKIIELRKKKGWTQEELVEKCNLNVRTLQRIESGEVNPRGYTIKIIYAALDYDTSNFSLDKEYKAKTYLENGIKRIYKQLQNFDAMKNSKIFFTTFSFQSGLYGFYVH